MILFTLGTEQYPFYTIISWLTELINLDIIEPEEIFIQYGSSPQKLIPAGVKQVDFLPESEFKSLVDKANIVVTHCGEGSILLLQSYKKPFIVVPRRGNLKEHIDDHQLEMAEILQQQGINIAYKFADLVKFLQKPKISPPLMQSEAQLCNYLTTVYKPEKYNKVMVVASAGGHFKYAQSLNPFLQNYSNISWATFRTATTISECTKQGKKTYWAYSPTNRNLVNLMRNLYLALRIFQTQEKPDLVVSTGAGIAVPFLLIARWLYNIDTIFIESKTRLYDLSLSAKILYYLGAIKKLIIRSPQLAERYKKSICINTTLRTQVLIGELLLQAGLISQAQIEDILVAQVNQKKRFGEYLVERGWLKAKTVEFFLEELPKLKGTKNKQPLGYYLQNADLLKAEQINQALAEQKNVNLKLGEIIVDKQWLKPETIKFFLEQIIN